MKAVFVSSAQPLALYVRSADWIDESGLLLLPIENNWDEVAIKLIDIAQFSAWLKTKKNKKLDEASDKRVLSKLDGFALEYMGPNGRDVIGLHHVVKLPRVEWLLVSEVETKETLISLAEDSIKQQDEQHLNFTPNIKAASVMGNNMTNKYKLWDKDTLMKRAMGKESLFNSIIHLFNEDMPPRMEALKCALKDGKLSEIRQVSHTIKGVAANVSGEQLMEQATNIELAAKEEDISKAQSYLSALCVAYEELKLAIAEFQQLSGSDNHVKVPMSKDDTKQSLHQLEKLLVEGSYIDLDEFSCLANVTEDKSLQAICDHLLSQLADYDYQEALISLHDLKNQLAKTALSVEDSRL